MKSIASLQFIGLSGKRKPMYEDEKYCTSFTLRKARLRDLTEIVKSENICFPEWLRFSPSDYYFFLTNTHFTVLIAEVHHKIAGVIVGATGLEKDFETGTIVTLQVIPQFRRIGIAQALVKYIEEEFRKKNIKQIMLQVQQDNIPALKLYESLGFVKQKILYSYYPSPEGAKDGIEMLKKISSH